jgi:hypothetical protein
MSTATEQLGAELDEITGRLAAAETALVALQQDVAALKAGQPPPDEPPDEPPPDEPPPDEPPPPPPPPSGARIGYGAAVTGGEGGAVIEVTTAAELREAVALSEPRIIVVKPPVIDLAGAVTIDPANPNLSIIGDGGDGKGAQLRNGYLLVKGANGRVNLLMDKLEIAAGDRYSPNDADAFGANARQGHVEGIYARNCTFAGAPDVVVALLGAVSEVTFERCVFAYGLRRSNHDQSYEDQDGHSYAFNLAKLDFPSAPHHISVVECAQVWCQRRFAATQHAEYVEFIDVVHYGNTDAPHGNPLSLAIVGNVYKKAPDAALAVAGKAFERRFWDYRSDSMPKATGAVYVHGCLAMGFSLESVSNDASVLAAAPVVPLVAQSKGSATTLARVLAYAGCRGQAAAVTRRALSDIELGAGGYENGLDTGEEPVFTWG